MLGLWEFFWNWGGVSGPGIITFVGTGPIIWITAGLVVGRGQTDFSGNYVGVNVSGTSLPFQLTAIALEIEPFGEWTFSA